MTDNTHILTLSCEDVRGIVAGVTGFIAEHDGNILESAQFGDASTGRFFLRIEFSTGGTPLDSYAVFKLKFHPRIAQPFGMDWRIYNKAHSARVLIMVSKYGHCLNDLLHRYRAGTLNIEIAAVVSNHPDFRELVEWHGIPFHHFPIAGDKAAQERRVMELFELQGIDTVVLARYMQVLSPRLCDFLAGKAINIHHSFLPSFKGAKPYTQAFDRGVKLIGATAHYVTTDLDEGPIIDQEVIRVDHTFKPEDLEAAGRDVECAVLARAIRYHIEHRVLVNGRKTVVFR